MSEILLQIDGKEVAAKEGMTILEAAQSVGVTIPSLCLHEKLEPYGGCRVCSVEVESRGRSSVTAACLYPVEKGLVVTTKTEKLDRIRKDSEPLQALALEYGADSNRFEKKSSFCIHCGLCVRYCAEVKKANALGFINRGAKKEISFIPEIASEVCWDCKECFELCPTSALQAAYVLIEALASTPEPSSPSCGGSCKG
jgi:NADH dehydrogenase/NADH:ubiquinone oxidoreductase subunit G